MICDYVSKSTILLCSSQTRLQPLPVQTQGMQLLKLFIQLYYNNSHQQYENEVSHSSMFKISIVVNHTMYKNSFLGYTKTKRDFKSKKTHFKTAGAVILQLALKLQKGNNFPVIPI